ncbi:hypothetical protein TRIUR3_07909 [Triticum urartu]|uniref:Uncharacterized protein n=1 Tax=Triticum urartu TaxID=4572 RepID=M7Z731_TRIUA|nr:hypothetical protein TRIUR3_07909 [Triticum urartu]
MELSCLPLVLLLCLLAGSSTTAQPTLPRMDRVWQQVDRANRRGPSIGLVMSYVAEDTALQASGYFRPWRVQPFVVLGTGSVWPLLVEFLVVFKQGRPWGMGRGATAQGPGRRGPMM